MNHLKELMCVGSKINVSSHSIIGDEANTYIESIFHKYKPERKIGHLMIGGDSIAISAEKYDSVYSKELPPIKGYVFFEQNKFNKNNIFVIDDVSCLCDVMNEAYGMEYFVSDENLDFLIAVNWYVVEAAGIARRWLQTYID